MNTGQNRRTSDQCQHRLKTAAAAAVCLLVLTLLPVYGQALAAEPPAKALSVGITADQTQSGSAANGGLTEAKEIRATASSLSAQDLSLFGVLSLGIIGLFWIRRHTSEL